MENGKQKNGITNIFYAVVGVATLMIAIIGATFAYYTATADNNNVIKGNMATIGFDVSVTKVLKNDEAKGGLIPMSNNMVQQALTKNASVDGKGICVDDNGNAVCQIYRITVVNSSTSSLFVDGYVTLNSGSGTPEDYPDDYYDIEKDGEGAVTSKTLKDGVIKNNTSMRWAQVFCQSETDGIVSSCSTAGNSTVRPDSGSVALTALGGAGVKEEGLNKGEILTSRSAIATEEASYVTIQKSSYEVIDKNFIRLSNHTYGNYNYTREADATSALVWNQFLEAADANATNNTGTSAGAAVVNDDVTTYTGTYTDAQVYYIVVWLSENGHNQTTGASGAASNATNFFQGSTTFISAQGNEVTATFSGSVRITPNTPNNTPITPAS